MHIRHVVAAALAVVSLSQFLGARTDETFGLADPRSARPPKPVFLPWSVQAGLDLTGLPANVLPALDTGSLLVEDARLAATGDKTLRYGFGRDFPFRFRDGVWHDLSAGARLWTSEVGAADAVGLRLHFAGFDLPPGAQVSVYAPGDLDHVLGPYESTGILGTGEFWTPTRAGERARIELFLPAGTALDPTRPPFVIDRIQHVYRDPLKVVEMLGPGCHNDVTCYSAWANTALACAGIGTVNQNALYCSGQMLNSTAADLAPYWMTANHCVGTAGGAASAEIYWRYQSTTCNGAPPSLASVPQSAVCTLLSGNAANDHTLLMIEGELPTGLFWAGWTSSVAATGTAGACIHHPQGTYKRISFGNYSPTLDCGGGQHFRVNWTSGPTEPGSSGSGFYRTDTQQFLGQLHCGPSACGSVTNDQYGRFADAYPAVTGFLAGGSDDTLEQNDTCAAARAMTPGTSASLIVKSLDEDWYRATVASGGQITIALAFTDANGDVDLGLYAACGGALLASSTGTGNSESINWVNAGATQEVRWRVYLYTDVRNGYSMTITQPSGVANDECASAVIFTSSVNGTTVGATNSVAGSCGLSATSPDVWYSVTPPCDGILSLWTCGSALDTVLSLYAACGGAELACNDDAPLGAVCGTGSLQSYLTWRVAVGTAYKVRVAGYNGATGTFTLRAQCTTGAAFCLGDGISGVACPCGNVSPAASGVGCLNSTGVGGGLSATGTASIGFDDAVLRGQGMPAGASCLYFQGDAQQGSGAGAAFGDGLRCAGGAVIRLGTKANDGSGASSYPGTGDAAIHVRGVIPGGGGTRHYQAWYRNAAVFCTASAFNLTNGYTLVWLP